MRPKHLYPAALVIAVLIVGAAAFFAAPSASPHSAIADSHTQAPRASASSGIYSMADIAHHASGASCWTAINGNVYDLTSFISQHPGGEGAILSICGTDGSGAFNAMHGNDGRAQAMLATFKIGTLAS